MGWYLNDYNEVYPRLWVGSHQGSRDETDQFDLIVHCAEGLRPDPKNKKKSYHDGFHDAELNESAEFKIRCNAELVLREWKAGKTVLVTCAAGLNRSGVVAAYALCLLGVLPEFAIAKVRKARGVGAISNESFVRFLYDKFGDISFDITGKKQ